MAEERERPLHELLSRDMVDIYVGSETTHWILHEKLLCHRSKFFRNIFYSKESKNKAFGLPDEDDEPFRMFVGWLYSGAVKPPTEEKDLGLLFDLYLMGEKWEIRRLIIDVLDAVRRFYHDTNTFPGLRRVQYVYANTEQDSPMRQLLVSSIARMLTLGEGIPAHWDKALRKNAQLAVDIIMCVQKWHLDGEQVPDARDESVVPIVEETEKAKEVKEEPQEESGNSNGISGVNGEDHETTNGVNGEEH
ncbi:hypothetical protein LTR50_002601 [Elasticomyces elasticus]|nr:hypothetical protein LTR50_002601 [Elasticomyces elasticus]